ncbi:hypothetical protein PN498_28340 [Oscillatoria sp. CS-180]|uniref:hypothetical protein n=1 Tax=Oscillatoria sp. CS-180 TaxID=3021720 RepID=UPI00232ED3CD|nr:hypothetical protein [Oscillatoria sp. CS-180]MDB9529929.1 hypothetical protein [Oscillatoria sp. CS-180]
MPSPFRFGVAGQRDRGQSASTCPLARYQQLEEIAANGWQLPTSELAHLLRLKTLSGLS